VIFPTHNPNPDYSALLVAFAGRIALYHSIELHRTLANSLKNATVERYGAYDLITWVAI